MSSRKGFTLIELMLSIAIIGILISITLPAAGRVRSWAREIKDATQLRSIHQGMSSLALWNADSYPVPSKIDEANIMIPEGGSKDLPRHVLSYMIFNGYFAPEITVSPAEINTKISRYTKFRYHEPDGTATSERKLAMWDPDFKATPADLTIGTNADSMGGCSYGILPFFGGRRAKWRSTGKSTGAVIGNRGPAYDLGFINNPPAWSLASSTPSDNGRTRCGIASKTLRIHGTRVEWKGYVAFNDNHVKFETDPAPATLPFTFTSLSRYQPTQPDNLFVNEKDTERTVDADTLTGTGIKWTNNFLRTWYDTTVSGSDTTAIAPYWD